jgi:hypothetical protein
VRQACSRASNYRLPTSKNSPYLRLAHGTDHRHNTTCNSQHNMYDTTSNTQHNRYTTTTATTTTLYPPLFSTALYPHLLLCIPFPALYPLLLPPLLLLSIPLFSLQPSICFYCSLSPSTPIRLLLLTLPNKTMCASLRS